MVIYQGARIDYRHVAVTNDVSACTVESERAWVFGDDPADQGGHLIDLTIIESQVPNEGDLCCHDNATLEALGEWQNTNILNMLGNETARGFLAIRIAFDSTALKVSNLLFKERISAHGP